MDGSRRPICVIGGGVSGLTTAIVLNLLGYRVRLLTEDIIANRPDAGVPREPMFASLYPAASIIPHTVAISGLDWHIRTSMRFYSALQFSAVSGVRRQRHFEIFEQPVGLPTYAPYMEDFESLPSTRARENTIARRLRGGRGDGDVWGWSFDGLFAEMPAYGAWLRKVVEDQGTPVLRSGCVRPADLANIPEPVIVNCAGYGSGRLFGDESNLCLVKGVLVRAFGRQADFFRNGIPFSYNYTPDHSDYATSSGGDADLYWYPRVDSCILGGTRLVGRLDTSGHWVGEEIAGPTVSIDGVDVPAPVVEVNRDLIRSATGVDIGGWPKRAAVGYRCMRTAASGGVRVEQDRLGGKLVIHNYGHGGGGVTLAWSCAVRVAQLLARDTGAPVPLAGPQADGVPGTAMALLADLVRLSLPGPPG